MKRILIIIFALSLLFSGCKPNRPENDITETSVSENPRRTEIEAASETPEPEPVTALQEIIVASVSDAEDLYTYDFDKWAENEINEIIASFKEKDTEYLSEAFKDKSGKAFEFIKDLNFSEFEITSKSDADGGGVIYYLDIEVENGADDIFTLGGKEWEIHIGYGADGNIFQFSPKGKIITKASDPENDAVRLCYMFSRNMLAFETISDFNALKNNFNHEYLFYLRLFGMFPEWDGGSYSYEEFSEKVYNLCRVAVDRDVFTLNGKREYIKCTEEAVDANGDIYDSWSITLDGETINTWEFMLPSFWRYAELAEYDESGDAGSVIVNYYGDMAYMFIAKTIKYNLEFSDDGIRIVSIESLYSNDDLELAMGST